MLERQIHVYTIPSLEPQPIKPIRNVVAFAVDEQQVRKPAPVSNPSLGYSGHADPIDFCVIKRAGISMFSLKDRLSYSRVRYSFILGKKGWLMMMARKFLYLRGRMRLPREEQDVISALPIANTTISSIWNRLSYSLSSLYLRHLLEILSTSSPISQ
jgi:hypothetical protein